MPAKSTHIFSFATVAFIAAAVAVPERRALKAAIKRLNQFELSVADVVAQQLPKPETKPAFGLSNARMPWNRGRRDLGGYDGDAEWLDDSADCGCSKGAER